MGELLRQFLKHGVVGSVAFVVDFALMVILHERLGMDPLRASVLSFLASVVVSYWGSMKWVFSRRDDISRKREFLVFMALSFVGLLLNSACMWLGECLLGLCGIDWTQGIYYMIVKVLATFVVTFYNFFSRRIFLDSHNPYSPSYDEDGMW